GDVVTRIQDRPVANAGSVQAAIGIARPGSQMPVVYLRDGREASSRLTIQPADAAEIRVGAHAAIARGLTLRNPADGAGAVVTVGEPGSSAAAAGVQAGDLVVEINGAAVADMADLSRRLGQAEAISLIVVRDGERVEADWPV